MTNYSTSPTFGEQRTLLHHVSWQLFEQLLAELGDHRNCRLTYDQGELEIMAPAFVHERASRTIDGLLLVLVEELELEIIRTGSLTCKREDLTQGVEPDGCYYIQHEAQVRHKDRLDLSQDPPPDLVVEVEYTSSALHKLSLYASLGVPELWRYDGQKLYLYQLIAGEYSNIPSLLSPPPAPPYTGGVTRARPRMPSVHGESDPHMAGGVPPPRVRGAGGVQKWRNITISPVPY